MRFLRDLSAFAWFGGFALLIPLSSSFLHHLPRETFVQLATVMFNFVYTYNIILSSIIFLLTLLLKEFKTSLLFPPFAGLILAFINFFITGPKVHALRVFSLDPEKRELFLHAHNIDLAVYLVQFIISVGLIILIRKHSYRK